MCVKSNNTTMLIFFNIMNFALSFNLIFVIIDGTFVI